MSGALALLALASGAVFAVCAVVNLSMIGRRPALHVERHWSEVVGLWAFAFTVPFALAAILLRH